MADINQDITINAPLEKVWASWDRFGDIATFHKSLKASYLVDGSPETGQGARRRCDLKNGKSFLMEELVGYRPMEQMEIVVYDSNLPVKSVRMMLTFSSPTATTTRVSAALDFTMKYGPVGRLMKIPARKGFNGDIGRLLASNKRYNEAA